MTTAVDPAHRRREDEVWRVVLPRLWRYARSRGLSPEDAYDAAQEAARRAIEKQVPYADAEDLLRWCQTVAANYAVDMYRKSRRNLSCEDLSEAPDPNDRLAVVETRHLLDQVIAELRRLPASQQDALVSHLLADAPVGRKEQDRLAQARQRARRVLRREVGYPVPALALLGGWLRRLLRGPALTASSVTLASFVALVVTLDSPTAAPPTSPGRPDWFSVPAPQAVLPSVNVRSSEQPVTRGTKGARVRRPVPTPRSTPILEQETPVGIKAGAEQRPAHPGDHLVCVGGGPIPEPVCLL